MYISMDKVLKSVNKVFETFENEMFPLTMEQAEMDFSEMNIDSFVFINLIVTLENDFEVEIPDEYLLMSELNCVKKVYDVIQDLMECKKNEYEIE